MSGDGDAWFARIKQRASAEQLYALLFAMPKGADLHVHLSGCGTPADWYELAASQGEAFWTRVAPGGCGHTQDIGVTTIRRGALAALPSCCRRRWVPLRSLTAEQRGEWEARLRLDQPGRTRFFHQVTGELKHLRKDPGLIGAVLLRLMHRAAAQRVSYLEVQTGPFGYVDVDGQLEPVERMVQRYRRWLGSASARATRVTVRLLVNVSRTAEDVRRRLRASFALASRYPDLWVGVHLSGQEEVSVVSWGELRSVYGSLRHRYPGVRVAVHAGEGFGAAFRVADALPLGVRRIGHGLNLVNEPETVERMRHAGVAVESSLISSQMLDHVPDPHHHPAGWLLRKGVPVCLSTDDPGVWGATLTDEFYLAATALDCSWAQLAGMARASLVHSFAPEPLRVVLLRRHEEAMRAFERAMFGPAWRTRLAEVRPVVSDYARRHLGVRAVHLEA